MYVHRKRRTLESDMSKNLTLGTAEITEITETNGAVFVRFMRQGSFLLGEQTFQNRQAALRFCRDRGLRIVK
jgi:hypothetical protein